MLVKKHDIDDLLCFLGIIGDLESSLSKVETMERNKGEIRDIG